MKKHTLTKEVLKGYLMDKVSKLIADMHEHNFHFADRMKGKMGKAMAVACKTVTSVTHADISAAFEALNECREAFHYVIVTAAELKAAADREAAEREAAERAEREREEAVEALPYISVNPTNIFNRFDVDYGIDKEQVRKQLYDAPLLSSLSAGDMYMKRHAMNYAMTEGHDAIVFQAVEFSDFLTRFCRTLSKAAGDAYYEQWRDLPDRGYIQRFFTNTSAMIEALKHNKIDEHWMDALSIRSPKFSKFLIKMFGEKAVIVRMFNDRPKAEELGKQEPILLDGHKVVLSNLAANVMKMTANNAFSSCQNYTYSDEDSLGNLSSLPSSVNDETLSIAYLCEDSESVMYPRMIARVLIKTFEYEDKLFFYGYNEYGSSQDVKPIISTLRAAYGQRFIYEDDNYNNDNLYEHTHDYGYDVQVAVVHEGDAMCECYECDGSGSVRATTRYSGIEFTAECPVCEGDGEIENDEPEGDTYESDPYVNGWAVEYDHCECTVKVDEDLLISAFDAEINVSGEVAA